MTLNRVIQSYINSKFIELKANPKAIPEREGGKRSLTEGF